MKVQSIIPIILLIVIKCSFLTSKTYAQMDNSYFSWKRLNQNKGDLSLQVENLNYFRNVEYKTVVDEGRTLLGVQFVPELVYQIGPRTTWSAGLFIQRDFGGEPFEKAEPTFQLKHGFGNSTFLFGRLEGNMDHGLIEPIIDPERVIFDRTENGFQYLLNHRFVNMDVWLDWQTAIYQNSPFREEFDAGVSTRIKLIEKDSIKLHFPATVLATHKGGEIDTSHQQAVSQFAFSYGTELTLVPKSSVLKSIRFGLVFNNYEDVSNRAITFRDGLGQLAYLDLKWSHFGTQFSYWDSHQFEASSGDVLYHTTSRQNPLRYTLDYRKLWMFRLYFEKQMSDDLNFLFRSNLIRDVHEETVDFIAEFYLRWTPTFHIAHIDAQSN